MPVDLTHIHVLRQRSREHKTRLLSYCRSLVFYTIRILTIAIGLYGLFFMFSDNIGSVNFKTKIEASPLFWSFHLIGGGLALILSTFVLSSKIRRHSVAVHRYLGKFYALAILFASVGGFVLSFETDSGLISGFGLGLLSLFWFYATFMAYITARNKQFKQHKIWVYRSFVLTLSAVLFRIELGILMEVSKHNYFDVYASVTWISWVPMLIITEWFIINAKSNA